MAVVFISQCVGFRLFANKISTSILFFEVLYIHATYPSCATAVCWKIERMALLLLFDE